MYQKRANEFEVSLQRAARGETLDGSLEPLIETARLMSVAFVPPPPRRLETGRARLVAEAARLRAARRPSRRAPVLVPARARLAAALLSLLLVAAFVPGLSHAVASSTAGSPLYALKLLAQEACLRLTTDPQARADLQVSLAQQQLGDIATALAQGESIDPAVASGAERQLSLAVAAVSDSVAGADSAPRLQLMNTLQNCHRVVMRVLDGRSDSGQEPLHRLLRSMERAREQLRPGPGQAAGQQQRAQEGTPADDQEFGPHGRAPATPGPQRTPAPDPGPPSGSRAGSPAGQQRAPAHATATPTSTPAPTAVPQSGEPAATPGDSGGQGQSERGQDGNVPADDQQPGHDDNGGRNSRRP